MLDVNNNLADIMKHLHLCIIASVDMPLSRDRLERLESDMMERLMTLEQYCKWVREGSVVNILRKSINSSGALFSNSRNSTGFLRGNFHNL